VRKLRTLVPSPIRSALRRTPPYRRMMAERHRVARLEDLASFAEPLEANGIRGQLSDQTSEWAPFVRFAAPGHFYSPIPLLGELAADRSRIWVQPASLPGIDINAAGQRAVFERLVDALGGEDLPDEPTPERRYHARNVAFGVGDALVLQGMLRVHRPRRIVEIGSGYSSALMLDVLERDLPDTHVTFVEPYTELLRSLMRPGDDERSAIIEARAQDLDAGVVTELGAGDVLFVDSTHVVRPGSDVCRIVLDLLPRVAPGVIVHVHDMFWPFELPMPWVEEGRLWSECYLIRALLTDNPSWEILLFNDHLAHHQRELPTARLPRFLDNPGGSLWLRRVDAAAASAPADGDDREPGAQVDTTQ
jgi:predicted O-methyltransferase YrrM